QFTYGSTIRITSLGPGQGPFSGGTIVTVFGSDFDEPVAVTLGGIAQAVLSVSGTEIRFVTTGLTGSAIPPCNGQTTVTLAVTNIEGGASASGGSFTFTGPPNPLITGVAPASGVPGNNTTISGQNFEPPVGGSPRVRVLFGGADGASATINSSSATSISVTVPTPPPTFSFTTESCDVNGDGVSGTRNLPTAISITVRNLTTACESTLSNAYTLVPPTTCNEPAPPPATPQCSDTFDNDSDGFIDAADPECTGPTDPSEAS
ncbi:MAG TPA: IPT/TIG domain-containing protein, partial [Thermoanaerobaculia bacterium]|nr:IPT/TIG domain-containing protein [Thermoanaerobaculia bacterium]